MRGGDQALAVGGPGVRGNAANVAADRGPTGVLHQPRFLHRGVAGWERRYRRGPRVPCSQVGTILSVSDWRARRWYCPCYCHSQLCCCCSVVTVGLQTQQTKQPRCPDSPARGRFTDLGSPARLAKSLPGRRQTCCGRRQSPSSPRIWGSSQRSTGRC